MLKAKELDVGIEEVKIPTCPIKVRQVTKEDALYSPVVDPHISSSSGATERVEVE